MIQDINIIIPLDTILNQDRCAQLDSLLDAACLREGRHRLKRTSVCCASIQCLLLPLSVSPSHPPSLPLPDPRHALVIYWSDTAMLCYLTFLHTCARTHTHAHTQTYTGARTLVE